MADLSKPMIRSPPVTRHGATHCLCRSAGDHYFFAHMSPCCGPGPGAWYAQSTPHTQIAHQLALDGASALDIESLIDGFMRNADGPIIRVVDLQTVGNLLRRPAIDPFAVTTMAEPARAYWLRHANSFDRLLARDSGSDLFPELPLHLTPKRRSAGRAHCTAPR